MDITKEVCILLRVSNLPDYKSSPALSLHTPLPKRSGDTGLHSADAATGTEMLFNEDSTEF